MENIEEYVQRRKGRCMAQVLEVFEEQLEPLLPNAQVQDFKALVRRKLNSFATDVTDVLKLNGTAKNGAAQDLTDRIWPDGRDKGRRGS